MRVLAGDIGGTKTLLRLAEVDPRQPHGVRLLAESRFESAAYRDLTDMVQEFLGANGRGEGLHAACFGVAGPVLGDGQRQQAQLTNLPWRLDSQQLAADLQLPAVRLINDFQAMGYGIEALGPDDLVPLQTAPIDPQAPRVVLGAGTGLGVALLIPTAAHYEVYPTEGGHTDFAPRDGQQEALLHHLRPLFGRVSYERIVSGPGLVAIYRFLLDQAGAAQQTDPLLAAADPAAAISHQAIVAADSRAAAALHLFVTIYGAFAGDLALTTLARGGVFVAGGIAPKIIDRLRNGEFISNFRDKGRMRPLVEQMSVQVVINQQTGLLGATLAASRL